MKTELIEISATKREIKIEIDPEAVKAAYNKVSQKYAKTAQVPGFRKGLASVDVVRMRFKDEIKQDVLQELLTPKVTEAIQEYDLTPLSEPQLHIEDAGNLKLNGSEPVKIHVHVEVMPLIPAPEYKGLEATRRIKPVSDSELENIIEEQRQQFATLIPVEDRPSADGDTVIIDLVGIFDDAPDAEPIEAKDLEVTIGDDLIEKAFSENLLGVNEDQEKEFTVTYPADFSSPALAGKTLNYKAKIKSVGIVELPEIDDEWAKSLDQGFESVENLREKLRADLEQVAYAEADNHVRNELIAKMIENNKFEVPNALIDTQARNLLNNFAQDLAQRGVDLEKVEKDFIEMAYNQMRTQAERDVRGAMLLDKIADAENAQVTSQEIGEEIDRMANYYQTTPEEIRTSVSQQEGGEDNIANSLRTRKAVESLVTHAKVTDGEWIDEAQSLADAELAEKAAEKTKEKSGNKKADAPKAVKAAKAAKAAKAPKAPKASKKKAKNTAEKD